MKYICNVLIFINTAAAFAQTPININQAFNTEQLIVVTTSGWNGVTGKLTAYSWKNNDWISVLKDIKIVTGWSGMAWGKGLHDASFNSGKLKKEGDGNSPAGIFPLTSLYGYGKMDDTGMDYLQVTQKHFCVDDPGSEHYNRIVDADSVKKDWKSAEKMILPDYQYKYGVVVGYNNAPVNSGEGSCIFMHIWNDKKTATSGCTAMTESNILKLIQFLDHSKKPLLIQLPLKEYARMKEFYQLPSLPN